MGQAELNFVLLDSSLTDVERLIAAMVQARVAVEQRMWSHPQEPTGEEWWGCGAKEGHYEARAAGWRSPARSQFGAVELVP
jgi:hypothetical protein